jgi:hypothetical protein
VKSGSGHDAAAEERDSAKRTMGMGDHHGAQVDRQPKNYRCRTSTPDAAEETGLRSGTMGVSIVMDHRAADHDVGQ